MIRKIIKIFIALLIVFVILDLLLFMSIKNQKQTFVILEKDIVVGVDDSFSKEEILQIQSALNEWEEKLNGQMEVTIHVYKVPIEDLFYWLDDDIITIYNARSFFSWPFYISEYIDKNHKDFAGLAILPSRDIFIGDTGNYFQTVVKHEFGHVLCCAHSNNKYDVMFPYVSALTTYITEEDVAQATFCLKNLGAWL